MGLGIPFPIFILLQVHSMFWLYKLIFYTKFVCIYPQTLFSFKLFSLQLTEFKLHYMSNNLIFSYRSLNIHFTSLYLLFISKIRYFLLMVYKFTNPFFNLLSPCSKYCTLHIFFFSSWNSTWLFRF